MQKKILTIVCQILNSRHQRMHEQAELRNRLEHQLGDEYHIIILEGDVSRPIVEIHNNDDENFDTETITAVVQKNILNIKPQYYCFEIHTIGDTSTVRNCNILMIQPETDNSGFMQRHHKTIRPSMENHNIHNVTQYWVDVSKGILDNRQFIKEHIDVYVELLEIIKNLT